MKDENLLMKFNKYIVEKIFVYISGTRYEFIVTDVERVSTEYLEDIMCKWTKKFAVMCIREKMWLQCECWIVSLIVGGCAATDT